eukprot:6936362-Pyramimonas_sp.AAC.1
MHATRRAIARAGTATRRARSGSSRYKSSSAQLTTGTASQANPGSRVHATQGAFACAGTAIQ